MTNLSDEEKSLPERLADKLISFILDEKLEPGSRLPNETILCQKLGASRSSLREAMKLLASRNIVTIRQGSGTYISSSPGIVSDPLGFTFIPDKQKLAEDLLEIRFILEPPIAARAALRATDENIKEIKNLCQEVEDLLRSGKDHTLKDIEFHTAIAMSSQNMVIPRLLPIINSAIPLFIQLTENILVEETIQVHRDITNAIMNHDPILAQNAMYLHLIHNQNHILKN